jgi:hypothetical protein
MSINNGTSETPQALAYLRARGIKDETIAQNNIELRPNTGERRLLARDYRLRLRFDRWEPVGPLHECLQETIWFRCDNANGSTESWIMRPFPVLPGKEHDNEVKFLTPKNGNGYPFIPDATWAVKEKLTKPLLVTEGAVKGLAALQAGAYPIAVSGVWMTAKKSDDAITLHPALKEFALTGRLVYLGFDADYETNPRVRQALIRTALLLYKAGAETKILIWPLTDGKGLDDYLCKDNGSGDPTVILKDLCEQASSLTDILRPADLDLVELETFRARLSASKLDQFSRSVAKPLKISATALKSSTNARIKENKSRAKSKSDNLKESVNTESNNKPARVKIILGTQRLESQFAEEVGQVLSPLEVVFRRDDSVVEIQDEQFTGELDRFKLARGGLKFDALTPARVRTSFEQYIDPGIDVEGQFVAKTMSESSARSLLVSPQFLKRVPRIDRILDVPTPIRKPDGEIIFPKPGFNRSLGIYCDPRAPEITEMPLDQAIEVIEKAIAGFCWKIPQSKIHAIARMLTPYARGVMGFSERMPLWYFVGNRPRCGKDYLNGITQIVYLGHAFEDAPITDNYEETSKRIVSALRAGRRMMHFANCQHHLNDPGFIQAITGPTINARSLGSNDAKSDLELPNEIDYSLSANVGLTYREDVEPRLRKIELAFFEEDANKRTFPNPFLHDWIKANRSRVLSAIHSLFQHWIGRGAPAGKTLFNSFPRWAEVVGGVMVTCGLGDPCLAHEGEDLLGGDLREVAMKALYQVAFNNSPEEWLRKVDIYDIIREQRENNDRLSWFGELDGDSKEKSFATRRSGNALTGFQNRILAGIRLEIDASNAKSQQWRYRFTKAL